MHVAVKLPSTQAVTASSRSGLNPFDKQVASIRHTMGRVFLDILGADVTNKYSWCTTRAWSVETGDAHCGTGE